MDNKNWIGGEGRKWYLYGKCSCECETIAEVGDGGRMQMLYTQKK